MKNVSQFLCAFIFLLMSNQTSLAQPWRDHMEDPTYNYYTVVQEAEAYFNQNPLQKSTPGSGYKPYIRWRIFWDGKVQFDNPSNNGNRHLATQLYARMVSNTVCNGAPANSSDWSALGPFSLPTQDIGIIISLWVNPANQNEVLAGSNSGGLFKTVNGGVNWTNITESSGLPSLGIRDILVRNTGVGSRSIFVATGAPVKGPAGFGIGVYRSDDEGQTWVATGLSYESSQYMQVYKLFRHPTLTNRVFAITSAGLVFSDNWFATVSVIGNPPGTTNPQMLDAEFNHTNSNILYLAGRGVWKLVFTGANWAWSTTFPEPVSHNPSADIGWAWLSKAANGDIYCMYKSLDGGAINDVRCDRLTPVETWIVVSDPTVVENLTFFEVNPTFPNVMYVGANTGFPWFRKSTNSGAVLNARHGTGAGAIHADSRVLVLMANLNPNATGSNDVLFLGNDGGVSRSVTGTENTAGSGWSNINGTGLNCTQLYGISVADLRPGLVVGGAQDNGSFAFENGNWIQTDGGDGFDVETSLRNPNHALGSFNGGLRRTENGGLFWLGGAIPNGEDWAFDNPVRNHPNGANYIAFENVHRINDVTDVGGSLTTLSNFQSLGVPIGNTIGAFAVAPTNENVIYCAFRGLDVDGSSKKLWRTTNGGVSWTDITTTLPGHSDNPSLHLLRFFGVNDIMVSPTNSSAVYITLSGFSTEPRTLYSTNGGNTWTALPNTGLPSDGLGIYFPTNHLEYRNGSNNQIYAATDAGVYFIDGSLSSWQCFNENLPIGVVQDLDIDYCRNRLVASVYGSLPCPL